MTDRPYSIVLSRDAIRTMRRLHPNVRDKIDVKLTTLAADPATINNNIRRLQGIPGFRIRIGDWRVLYEVDHRQRCICVRCVVPRGEDYKP